MPEPMICVMLMSHRSSAFLIQNRADLWDEIWLKGEKYGKGLCIIYNESQIIAECFVKVRLALPGWL